MKRTRLLPLVIVVCSWVVIWGAGPSGVYGGDLEPPLDAVDESGQPVSTMRTLDEIYNLIDERCPTCKAAGVSRTGFSRRPDFSRTPTLFHADGRAELDSSSLCIGSSGLFIGASNNGAAGR